MAIMHTLFSSATLKRRCAMNVFVPEKPHSDGKPGFPVVYLLHGRSDDENSYADHGIRALCEKYEFIVVMPDGARSFYCDMKSGEKYWTFISEELPAKIKEEEKRLQYYQEKYESIRRWGSGTSFPQIDRETENPTSDGAFVPVPDVTGI